MTSYELPAVPPIIVKIETCPGAEPTIHTSATDFVEATRPLPQLLGNRHRHCNNARSGSEGEISVLGLLSSGYYNASSNRVACVRRCLLGISWPTGRVDTKIDISTPRPGIDFAERMHKPCRNLMGSINAC